METFYLNISEPITDESFIYLFIKWIDRRYNHNSGDGPLQSLCLYILDIEDDRSVSITVVPKVGSRPLFNLLSVCFVIFATVFRHVLINVLLTTSITREYTSLVPL